MSKAASKGVLFDLDGVLVDSLDVMRMSFESAYRDVHGDDGADLVALFRRYRRHLGKGLPQILGCLGLSAQLVPHFKRHSRYLAPYVRVFPGVRPLLQSLRSRGWVLGVATGKDESRANDLLKDLRLRDHFAVVLGCDSVPAPKPAPDMVHAFAERTGVARERMVMVGDAPADLQCARAAPCRSVAALWGFTPSRRLQQEKPDWTADTPQALLPLLWRIEEERS
jgi:3-amino-5-hydroxybenzoic acid synthesis related protein